ncbi:hypothetical protein LIER_06066 [Lithospermum erythrorhizon]|uniref:Uncharacterized protein n=1 Tax=Lithospermum erythrorhizon TaxID=34254 RepID=A0AAV3P2Y5_LITER
MAERNPTLPFFFNMHNTSHSRSLTSFPATLQHFCRPQNSENFRNKMALLMVLYKRRHGRQGPQEVDFLGGSRAPYV